MQWLYKHKIAYLHVSTVHPRKFVYEDFSCYPKQVLSNNKLETMLSISDKLAQTLRSIPILIGKNIKTKKPMAFQSNMLQLFDIITNANNQYIEKTNRYFLSQSKTDIRPTSKTKYSSWSGIQLIDLDIKNAKAAEFLKPALHKFLSKQPWYLCTVFSSSHTGLHVYAVSNAPHDCNETMYFDNYENIMMTVWHMLIRIYEYYAKLGTVDSSVLVDIHPILNISSRKEDNRGQLSESNMIDLAMTKLSQPILLPYDDNPLINELFTLEPPYALNLNRYQQIAESSILKEKFDKRRHRCNSADTQQISVNGVNLPELSRVVPRNYNNTARYRLAYALCNLYDISSQQSPNYKLIHDCFMKMCSGNPKYRSEQRAFDAVFQSAMLRQMQGLSPLIAWAVNELKTVHGISIDTNLPEIERRKAVDIDVDIEFSKPVFIPSQLQIPYKHVYKLTDNQYVSDGTTEILSNLNTPNSVTLLVAEPGTGKTVFVTNLMKTTNLRILCVVPFISVIESKFKTLPPECCCQYIYGFTSYDATGPRNAVMTFDKFSKMQPNDIDCFFDLVAIDEIHLTQMSAYRGLVPANLINNVRATKVPTVLMTGTPIAEHMFMNCTDIVKFIRNRQTEKLFNLIICNNPQEKFANAVLHITNAIQNDRKVIVPTNEGNSFIEKVTSAVQTLLGRALTYFYYKKENNDMEFMQDVNYKQTIGDTELLFCSSYLSVGVDINDNAKFDLVYMEDFTPHEIEQFNNRLRRVDLVSYYFVAKYQSDGFFKESLISRKIPNLGMSNIRELELADLLALNTTETTEQGKFIKLYDFLIRHMNMPYIIRNVDGTASLHATCYSLFTFEQEWRTWSTQIPVLLEILKSYNYQISVINAELMDANGLDAILTAGRNGFHLYKDIETENLLYVASLLENKNFFNLLVYTNLIRLIHKTGQGFNVDLERKRLFLYVQNVNPVFRFMRVVRLLSKYYSRQTILSIYHDDATTLSKLEHVFQTVELLDYASNDRLTTSNIEAMQYVINKMFDGKRVAKFSKAQINYHISKIAEIYKAAFDLRSENIITKVHKTAESMLKRLATQETKRKGIETPNDWSLKTIPKFDSINMQHQEVHKMLIYTMFQAVLFESNPTSKISGDVQSFFKESNDNESYEYVDTDKCLENLKELETDISLTKVQQTNLLNFAVQNYPSVDINIIRALIGKLVGYEGNLTKRLSELLTDYLRGNIEL